MKRRLYTIIILTVLTLTGQVLSSYVVLAAHGPTPPPLSSKDYACQGIGLVGGNGCGDNGAAVNHAITVFVNLLSAVIGVIAVVMIVIGGLKFITSNGDTSKVTSAKVSLTYALVGLVIVAISQMLVHFVLSHV